MEAKYSKEQLGVIRKIAQIQIQNLIELQRNPELLHERVEESREKGFDEVTISDYYEDIAESWEIWENILETPETFLFQRFFHNYHHIQFVIENLFTPEAHEQEAWEGLVRKLALIRSLGSTVNC